MPRKPGAESGYFTRRQAGLKRWLQVHQRVARSSALRLLAQPGSSLLTVLVIAVSLLLPALLSLLNANLDQLLVELQQDTQISVYLEETITEPQGRQVSEDLLLRDDVRAVRFISSTEGLTEFSLASGLGEILSQLPSNPLPATILVTPATEDAASISQLAAELEQRPDVALIQLDRLWLQRLAAISQLITVITSGLTVIVVMGLFVIVGNTIKLSIENRRQEISVIKLVGGTDAFIARPFLYSGLYYGSAGGFCAVVLQLIVLAMINGPIQELLSLYDSAFALRGDNGLHAMSVILAGAAIGWAAALLASLRHIRSLEP